jgi:hypothetical protein
VGLYTRQGWAGRALPAPGKHRAADLARRGLTWWQRGPGLTYPLRMVLVGPDGVRVEQVVVQRDLRRPPKTYLRVTHLGYWQADCSSPAEVGKHVDLAAARGAAASAAPGHQ